MKKKKGFYYRLREQADVCDKLMDAFGVIGKHRHIINGHVPRESWFWRESN